MLNISLQIALFFLTKMLSYHKDKEFSHWIKTTAVSVINPKAVSIV